MGDGQHSIGKTIARLRKQKGWTQAELAEKLNISDKTVSKWEKDSGAPSIEFFPAIADLFGVSIDYIMLGKEPEKEVVTISKAELCAKKDDPALLGDISITRKDEQDKTLIDYILQYQSGKVFVEFCKKHANGIAEFGLPNAIEMAILTNHLELLRESSFCLEGARTPWKFESERDLLELYPAEEKENCATLKKPLCILGDDFFKTIVSDPRIEPQTMKILLGEQSHRKCIWYQVLPYLIHQSYVLKKEDVLGELIAIAKKNNETALKHSDEYKTRSDWFLSPDEPVRSSNRYSYGYGSYGHTETDVNSVKQKPGFGVVRILEKTVRLALEQGDFKFFDIFQNFNKELQALKFTGYLACEYDVRMAKLRADKTVSKEELTIQSAIHDGLINMTELLATQNLPLIKKALSAHDIHPAEAPCKMFRENDRRALFRYAVEHKDDALADAVIKADKAAITEEIAGIFFDTLSSKGYPAANGTEFILKDTPRIVKPYRGYGDYDVPAILKYFSAYRKQVISALQEKEEENKALRGLTKKYFESELKKGNSEIVVIKLCVRMEAILRITYEYEGDFSEMLDRYCSKYGTERDARGHEQQAAFVGYLQKLRMCRNSIVHADKKTDMLTKDELTFCINYICDLK